MPGDEEFDFTDVVDKAPEQEFDFTDIVDSEKKNGSSPSGNVSKTGGENPFPSTSTSQSTFIEGKGPLAPKKEPALPKINTRDKSSPELAAERNFKEVIDPVIQQAEEWRNAGEPPPHTTAEVRELMNQSGFPAYVKPEPHPDNTQQQNFDIEIKNIREDGIALNNDAKVFQQRGDEAGMQEVQAKAQQLDNQAKQLLVTYPDAIDRLKEQPRIDKAYSGFSGTALETAAMLQNGLIDGIKKVVAFAPKTASQLTGVEGGPSEQAYKAIENFFDSPAMKFGESSEQFQNEDGSLNWNKLAPAVSRTMGNMIALLGTAEMMGGNAPALFTSSYTMTRNDYYDLAKSKGLSGTEANAFADVSAGLTSMLEMVSPNASVLSSINKGKLADDYIRELAKGQSAAKSFLVKEIIPENVQEISQMIGDKVVQSGADLMTGQDKFNPDYFNPSEYASTIVLTTLTTGLVAGGLGKNKSTRANALAELSKNPEKTAEIVQAQVENNIITPEEGQSVLQQVQRHLEASQKVPDAIPEEKRADVTEMVAEKTDIENSIKDKDPALILRQQADIEKIENELINIASPELAEPEEKTTPKGETKTNNNTTNGEKNAQGEGNQETRLLTPQTEDTGAEQSAPAVEQLVNEDGEFTQAAKNKADQWIMNATPDEIMQRAQEVSTRKEKVFVKYLGEEGYRKYKRLERIVNSNTSDRKEALRAEDELRELEGEIPKKELLNAYAKPEEYYEPNEWKRIINALDATNPDAIKYIDNEVLFNQFGREITQGDIFERPEDAIIARESYRELKRRGLPDEEILLNSLSEREKKGHNSEHLMELAKANIEKIIGSNAKTKAPQNIEEAAPVETTNAGVSGDTGTTTTTGTVLTEPEKSNLQNIEAETGDNFRLIENTIRKYSPDVPIETATAEDYDRAKAEQAKIKAQEEEADPGKKVRQMAKKFRKAGFTVPKTLAEYTPVTQEDYMTQADKIVEELGVEGATAFLLNQNYVMDDRLRPALGGRIMTELNRLEAEAEASGDQESLDLFADLTNQVMNVVLPSGTKHAQALAMFATFYKGTPFRHIKEVQNAIDKLNEGKKNSVKNLVEQLNRENKAAVEEAVNKLFGNRVISDKVKKAKERYEKSKTELKDLFNNYKKTGISPNPYERAKQDLKFNRALAKTAKDFIVYQSVKFEEFIKEVASNLGITVDDIDKTHLKKIFDEVKSKEIGKEIKSSLKEMEVKLKDLVKDHYSEIQKTGETLAEKIKNEFGLEEKDADEVAKAVKEEFNKITAKEKVRIAKASGISIWKEIVDLSDQGLLESQDIIDQLSKKLGIIKMSPEVQNQLVKLAKEINNIPENATSDRARAIQNLVDYKYKVSKELGYGDYLISNFLTNIFGSIGANAINTATNVIESLNLASRGMYRAFIDGDFGDIRLMMKAILSGHKTGLRTAGEIIKTGVNPRKDIGNITPRNVYELIGTGDEMLMGSVEKYFKKVINGEIGKVPQWIVKGGLAERKFWSRMLGAMDGLSGTANMEIAAITVAQMEADARNLSGRERSKFIRDSVFGDSETIAKAQEEAKAAGFKEGGRKYNERVLDYVIANRPQWLYEKSKEIAQRATLTNSPPDNSITGWTANRITSLSGKNPSMKFIFPAVNSLANLYIKLYERTPLEFLSLANDKVRDKFRSDKITPEEYQRRFENAAMATVVGALLFAIAGGFDDDEGGFEIYGTGTGDRQLDAQKRNTGWRPHTIRFSRDGGYYDYSYLPINFLLGLVGDLRDWSKYNEDVIDKLKEKISDKLFNKPYDSLNEEQRSQVYAEMDSGKYNVDEIKERAWWEALSKALMSPVKTFMDFGVMTGLNDVIGILAEREAGLEARVKKFTSNVAGGLTFPSYFKEIKSATDPNIYENKTWLEQYLSKQPFIQVGDVKLDAFGRDITQYSDKAWHSGPKYVLTRRFYSEPKGTPLDVFLNNNNIKVNPPQNRDFMDDNAFDEFVKRQGALAGDRLNELLSDGKFEGKSPNEIQDMVGDEIQEIRRKEKVKIIIELDEGVKLEK